MTINQEADQLVNGPRQADYGHPMSDFTTTGKLWGAIIGIDPLEPETVALMMAALKLSRLTRNPGHHDSQVDVCGYMATYELIRGRRDELEGEQTVGTPTDQAGHEGAFSVCQHPECVLLRSQTEV